MGIAVRLLVVEDEKKLAFAVDEGLQRAGYTVDLVFDGDEALHYARCASYDGIVLDILLPKVDGLEVCRRLRAAGQRTPVLLLTAKDAVPDRVAGLDSGADDYLVKPFAFDELLARLRALLRRDLERKDSVLRAGELRLDPARREVQCGDRPLEFTPREFNVLEVFLRHPGWVVTRETLIESVWGLDFSDASNLVDVYVGRVRRKLQQQATAPTIQTVRGAGYRLVDSPG